LNTYASDFIETVLGQIKYKKAHASITVELQNHISEQAEGYMAESMGEDEAFCKAVAQMGNPAEIGKRLHKTHKPKTEWSIMLLLGAIVVFGLYIISIYSSLYFDYSIFYKQVFFAGLGICAIILFYFFDYTKLEKYSIPLYFVTSLLLLLAIMFGSKMQGRAYIQIWGFGFIPSFVAIPLILIFYAGLVKKWCDGNVGNLLKLIGASGLPLFIILLEPSLIYCSIVGVGLLTMFTFGICGGNYKGNRRKTLIIIYGSLCALVFLIFVYVLSNIPYGTERFTVFLNPQRYARGAGYTNVVLDNILSSSKFLGSSESTYISGNGLPSANSEFIFTFVVGSLGWLFGILLIVLLGLIILRLFVAASKVRHEYGKYLCVGICCVFSLQVIVNLLMNLGLCPIFNVALPFFSYGGASYLFNMALIGLLLGVYRRKDIIEKLERNSLSQ